MSSGDFIDLRLNREGEDHNESFWPSFTDIMTVIVMIFLLAMVVLLVRNMELVNELHLHNNRIEALIDQLYGINRRIMSIDSNMVKLADQARINRRDVEHNRFRPGIAL